MEPAHLIATALCVLGLAIRDIYELLKRRALVDTEDVRVFTAVFASMCVMWVSWFSVGWLDPAHVAIAQVIRWVGLGAVLAGAVLAVGGMWQLGGVENIDHLVTTGMFSRIRHPMYIGFILWILGWCAFTEAVTSLVLAPFLTASVVWWRHLEEAELEARYGDEYSEYRALTWI